jgi:PAT family beta-lactamase induction signal transducer AmpG
VNKLALLSILYFAEGLPFGFQAFALPIYLRESGTSLVAIGFLGALSLPWMFKFLWAPLVDRYGATRRSWMLPLLLGLALTCGAAGLCDPATRAGLAALLALVFLMNLLAATLDIAVDGLAVDLLGPRELGPGNAAQVVGYKIGMLSGGGLFVLASSALSWRVLLALMGAVLLAVLLATLAAPSARTRLHPPQRLRVVFGDLARALAAPAGRGLLLFLVTYKLGESMAGAMWKPFLVDAGFDKAFIGVATGVWGMAASIAGSVLGGVLAARLPLLTALLIPAAARVVPLAAQALVALGPDAGAVVIVTCLENLAGGALTTVVFATMMARVDRRIGASHYTALAAIEVAGKLPGQWASGVIATALGYPALFGLAAGVTLLLLPLALPLRAKPVHDLH